MALFPITGYYQGDFIPHLIAADTDDTMDQVAARIARHTLDRRLPKPPEGTAYDVVVDERTIAPDATLGSLGLEPLHWVDVRPRS